MGALFHRGWTMLTLDSKARTIKFERKGCLWLDSAFNLNQAGDVYMNTRRHLRGRLSTLVGMVAIGLVMLLAAPPAQAQQVTTLIQFTNVWKYDQTGAELGTGWRTNDFDDSALIRTGSRSFWAGCCFWP